MAAIENLDDRELRLQLKQYGEVPGPITSTTRAIYIKRLQNLKDSHQVSPNKAVKSKRIAAISSSLSKGKGVGKKSSAHGFGFSSDDSDNEGMNLRKKGSNISLQRKKKTTSAFQNVRKSVSSPVNNLHSSSSTPSAGGSSAKITNGYSDDSDDDADMSQGSWVQMTSAVTNTSPGLLSGWNSSSSVITRRRSLRNRSPRKNEKLDDTNSASPPNGSDADTSANVGDSSLQGSYIGTSKYSKRSQRELKNGGDCLRRKAFSNTCGKENFDQNEDSSLDKATEKSTSAKNVFSRLKNYFSSSKVEQASTTGFTQSKEPAPRSWSVQCAYLLPACTIIFFCTLGLLYITMKTDNFGPAMLRDSLKVSDQQAALTDVNAIYEVLGTRAGDNICEGSDESNLVSLSEIQSSVQNQLDRNSLLKALQLIRERPEWNIFLYKNKESASLQDSDSVSDTRFLETTSPIFPTLCRFQRAIQKVLWRVFMVVTVCLSIWLMVLYRQYRLRKNEEERQVMFTLISKILDVLRKQHETSLDDKDVDPYLPIIHVRDMIIAPEERSKMSKVWEMAVRFISASESRVRVETQRVSGEDFSVWRWIQVTSPGKRQQAPRRVWQGGAFDTNQSINTPNISPTPCLKIRNMFDPDVETNKDWHLQIQDSILEKCTGWYNLPNEVQSVQVEKTSKEGLVYVKCESCAGAGKAFQALHGAWFDGRLVTVKFIKLHRFHTRYPDTANQNTPLDPASPKPVSTFSAPDSPSSGFLTSTPLKST